MPNNLISENYDDIKEIPGYPKIPLGRAINLSGKIYGNYKILYRTSPITMTGEACWVCECQKCFKLRVAPGTKIKQQSISCECSHKTRALDLAGKKFGHLTAIRPLEERKYGGTIMWECLCDCGNITTAGAYHLKSGNVISCGCYQKEVTTNNLIGKKFGQLLVLQDSGKRTNDRNIIWVCKCLNCGSICEVPGKSLTSGDSQSCGCVRSRGEFKIKQLLNKYNIYFKDEYIFENCKFPNTQFYAKFDFYINNKYLIEYDGRQHYINEDNLWTNEQTFQKIQYRDNFKNQWCKENNIPLIRIPYWHYDDLCLEDLLLETTQFRVV